MGTTYSPCSLGTCPYFENVLFLTSNCIRPIASHPLHRSGSRHSIFYCTVPMYQLYLFGPHLFFSNSLSAPDIREFGLFPIRIHSVSYSVHFCHFSCCVLFSPISMTNSMPFFVFCPKARDFYILSLRPFMTRCCYDNHYSVTVYSIRFTVFCIAFSPLFWKWELLIL